MMVQINNLPDPKKPLESSEKRTVLEDFLGCVKRFPDSIACSSIYGECTYRQLEDVSRRVSNCLHHYDIRKGDRVTVISDRNPALIYAMLAAFRTGVVFNVVDYAYPPSRILSTIQLLKPRLVLVCGDISLPDEVLIFLNNIQPEIRLVEIPPAIDAALGKFGDFNAYNGIDAITPSDLAYITFTSGSTGKPKGVVTSHAPLPHFISWHVSTHKFTENDRVSLLSGLSHDPVMRDIFTPLSVGATICIPNQSVIFDPPSLISWLIANRISVCHLTPALGEVICTGAEENNHTLETMRYFFWGGDSLSKKTYDRIVQIAPDSIHVNFYGATETPQAMGYFRIPDNYSETSFPLGSGISDTQLLVVTEKGVLAISFEWLS
jgi:non-ribosomal peptide synthetase component F